MDILKSVSFGSHYFEIAETLRNSILVNGMLTNSKVWYGLTNTEVTQLEEVDRLLLRQVFNVASSCPVEALYLELGCIPLGSIIKSRRVNYLHHLVTRQETEMLSNFFNAQWKFPARKSEWTEQVRVDLLDLGLTEDLDQIKIKSKFTFKNLVKKQIREWAFQGLLLKKQGHSKMMNLEYTTLEMQNYLKDHDITVTQAKMIFKYRTRMENFSDNFRGGKPTKPCPVCKECEDTQIHSFKCRILEENIKIEGRLLDIFKPKVEQKVAKTIEKIVKIRENYLEKLKIERI